MYEATNGHELFTVENIKKMQEIEIYFQTFNSKEFLLN